MKNCQLVALLVSLAFASGCERPNSGVNAQTEESAPTPAAAPSDYLVKSVVADGVAYQPGAAQRKENALVSTGDAGFMMYGPYVPFPAGKYRVQVKGSIPNLESGANVRFDVVSDTAKSTHAEYVVDSVITAGDSIAEFDVTIPEGVADLELRAWVTDGTDVRIESYQIAKTN